MRSMRSLCVLFVISALACDDDAPPLGVGDSGVDSGPAIDAGVDSALPDAGADPDVGAEPDVGGGDDAATGALCPPSGPFGTNVGDVAADVTLFDCEGNEVQLHDLCEAEAGWLFEFADWCPPCRSFAGGELQNVYNTYSAMGVQGFMVVSQDRDFNVADAADCAEIRDRYSLTIPVLYDPSGAVQTALGIDSNATNVIFDPGMRIRWKDKYAESQVAGQLMEALAD